jgi:hypothetical protein
MFTMQLLAENHFYAAWHKKPLGAGKPVLPCSAAMLCSTFTKG